MPRQRRAQPVGSIAQQPVAQRPGGRLRPTTTTVIIRTLLRDSPGKSRSDVLMITKGGAGGQRAAPRGVTSLLVV